MSPAPEPGCRRRMICSAREMDSKRLRVFSGQTAQSRPILWVVPATRRVFLTEDELRKRLTHACLSRAGGGDGRGERPHVRVFPCPPLPAASRRPFPPASPLFLRERPASPRRPTPPPGVTTRLVPGCPLSSNYKCAIKSPSNCLKY